MNRFFFSRPVCILLSCSFGGQYFHIVATVLSVMTQQCPIVDDALHCHLSPSTCRCGTLVSRSCSLTFTPLLHPLLSCARPFLVGCCVSIDPSVSVRGQDVIFLLYLLCFCTVNDGNSSPHLIYPTCFPCRTSLPESPHPQQPTFI